MDSSLREPFVEEFAVVYAELRDVLDERQRRLLLGAAARRLGRGGIKRVAAAVGADPQVVSRGVKQVAAGPVADGRVRAKGAGRPPITQTAPGVVEALEALVEPVIRGNPESPLRWTSKSTVKLAQALTAQGFPVGANTVAKLLKGCGYALQANAKLVEGRPYPDRDAQFEYVNDTAVEFLTAGDPVISVDTRKRELVGGVIHAGRAWRAIGELVEADVRDFPGDAAGVASPYGMGANSGWVDVGCDHSAAGFAVESIRRWWRHVGADIYLGAKRLLITAGGVHGPRMRLWKAELARVAEETGLALTVTHLPRGTSKWNRVEHRLFSHTTINRRGRPLESHEVVVRTIAPTSTRAGLAADAVLGDTGYPVRPRISDRRMRDLLRRHVIRHEFHGEWNYDIDPVGDDDHRASPTSIILGPRNGQ